MLRFIVLNSKVYFIKLKIYFTWGSDQQKIQELKEEYTKINENYVINLFITYLLVN